MLFQSVHVNRIIIITHEEFVNLIIKTKCVTRACGNTREKFHFVSNYQLAEYYYIEYSNTRVAHFESSQRHWVECVQEPYFRVECVAITKRANRIWTSRERNSLRITNSSSCLSNDGAKKQSSRAIYKKMLNVQEHRSLESLNAYLREILYIELR